VKYLLDTQAWIWSVIDHPRLSDVPVSHWALSQIMNESAWLRSR
jgi:hypothetical protein